MTRRRRSWHSGFLIVVGAIACAPHQSTAWRDAPAESSTTILRAGDMQEGAYPKLGDAIRALRPRWLLLRPGASQIAPEVTVYLDGSPIGGAEALEGIPTAMVRRVERLSATDAEARFGSHQFQGVIVVDTRRP